MDRMMLSKSPPWLHWDTPEHEDIGNLAVGDIKVTLPNGIQLSVSQICALAGDFYGVPGQPIIETQGGSTSGRRERFLAAYNTLARAPYEDTKKELDQILKVLAEEKKEIADAVRQGKTTQSVYKKIGNRDVEQWDEITGGKWIFGVPVIFGRVMKLAQDNFDHFQPNSKEAYLVGHQLALEKAREAGNCKPGQQQKQLFDEARSLEAFASHFLTDSFSAGHIRTPRIALAKDVTPGILGDYLSKYMHDEDNNFGLRVTNETGDKWIAFGDGTLMDPENKGNLAHAVDAFRKSFEQVNEAFQNPSKAINPNLVLPLIPFVDEKEKNNTPMFEALEGGLPRRADLNNLQDPKTVGDWLGWSTLAKLWSYKPTNSAIRKTMA